MRLIDADLLDVYNDCPHSEGGFCHEEDIQEWINRQPTAFDKAKVLEEFNKRIDPNVDMDTGEQCNNWVVDMQNEIIGELGKIVIAGGVKHDTE